MPDAVRIDENHNVIKPIMEFIFRINLHLSFISGVVVAVFGLLANDGSEFCTDRNLNVKPSEYYDHFSLVSCERLNKNRAELKSR